MSTKSITGTGLLLAVALLAQSLRLIFPFIPNQVSMFLIGSITSATFVLATCVMVGKMVSLSLGLPP